MMPLSPNAVFCDIFTHLSRLQILNLKCCTLLDNAAVTCLTQSCPYLQSLCLSGCHMISDNSVMAISLKSKCLQALDLTKTKVGMACIQCYAAEPLNRERAGDESFCSF